MAKTTPRYDLAILREQATEAAAVDGALVEVDGEELLAVLDELGRLRDLIRDAGERIDHVIASGRLDFYTRDRLREARVVLGSAPLKGTP